MAQVINVDKKKSVQKSSVTKKHAKKSPLFRKENFILMGIGLLLLGIGYILLSGGKAPSDAEFSDAIFNTRRMVVAPTLILAGLVIEVFAIMYHPRNRKKDLTETESQE